VFLWEKKMRKTIASFAVIGAVLVNVNTYGMNKANKWVPVHAKQSIQDARPFTEYIKEADEEGQGYGQLLRIIGGENFKDDFKKSFDENYPIALSITKGFPDDDKYKFLGLCWCDAMYGLTGDKSWHFGSDGKFPSPALEEIWDTHNKIRFGELKSSAEWVSDILYSAAFHANETIISASWKSKYLCLLYSALEKNYEKERNYEFCRIYYKCQHKGEDI
jgi:hypothetical protein